MYIARFLPCSCANILFVVMKVKRKLMKSTFDCSEIQCNPFSHILCTCNLILVMYHSLIELFSAFVSSAESH